MWPAKAAPKVWCAPFAGTAAVAGRSTRSLGVMRTIAKSDGFEWFEVWILVALLMAAKGRGTTVSLARLIGVADVINHAIITRDELEIGLGHLIDAGYLSESRQGFRATRLAVTMWGKSAARRGYVHTAWRDVNEAVGGRECSGSSMPKTNRHKYVSKSEYAAAVKNHLSEMSGEAA